LLTACLLALAFVTFPIAPTENDPDHSLGAVLHHAQQHRVQFGTELVSTYGPLGFLIFPHYAHHAAAARLAVDGVVCLLVASGICLVAWRLSVLWRCLLLLSFMWVAANIRPGSDLVLQAGLFSWGLLCFLGSGLRLTYSGLVFAACASFCALAKNSLLLVATAGIVVAALDAGLRDRRAALAMLGSFVGLFTAGWLGSGQHLENVGAFVMNSLAVIAGYNAALGVEGLQTVMWAGTIIVLLLGAVVMLRSATAFAQQGPYVLGRRACLLAFVAVIAFASWKHGFVRGDAYHAVLFLGLVPVLVLALETVRGKSRLLHWAARVLGLLACVLSMVVLQVFYLSSLPDSLVQPFSSFRASLQRVSHARAFWREMDTAVDVLRAESQLPQCRRIIGKEPVDVFGQGQVYALFSELNYRPRPVFQSYSACSARLMQFNEEQFFSDSAAAYVLFELKAIDRKFPSLEDAWLLRDLLVNCDLVTQEGRFLLLKRKSSISPSMTLVAEGTVRPGERIDLGRFGEADLWLEVTVNPTIAGLARQFAYRPSTIRLAAWGESGKPLHRHQAAASMLSAGFVASPLLLRTEDVLQLFKTNSLLRPRAYSVELAEHDHFWQDTVRFRVYRMENRLTRAPLNGPIVEPAQDLSNTSKLNGPSLPGGSRAFTVFRDPRWRPGEEPPGSFRDKLS
jgi:hypothetical protein